MRVLCFGDSNTYGFDPRPRLGGRYPAQHRWVDLLAEQSGWEVLNGGENGREIPRHESELTRFQLLLQESQPIDLLTVMLGGNDLLRGASPEEVTARMEAFLTRVPLEQGKIVLVATPNIQLGTWVPEERLIGEVPRMTALLGELAQKLGIRFVDTGDWPIGLAFDGVHFTEEGHHAFADKLFDALTH